MALVQNQVSLLVGANGFALWHYRTNDLKATIHGANYFNGVAGQLNVGDFICYNTADANEMASVVSITAGVVVLSAGTAVMSASAEQKVAIEKAMTPEERAAKKAADEKAAAELEASKKAAAEAEAAKRAEQHPAQHPAQPPRNQVPGR